MNLETLQQLLDQHAEKKLVFQFAAGDTLAPHFHITEVGCVTKDFVDCGGTRRSTRSCVLQTLVADDLAHRLTAGKLGGILEKASVLQMAPETPVELEIQRESVSLYALDGLVESDDSETVTFVIQSKQTACLAPDRCGIPSLTIVSADGSDSQCSGPGCC